MTGLQSYNQSFKELSTPIKIILATF